MTVAITFALTDGAILMTDGRRTNLKDDSILTDNHNKIHRLTPSLSVATYGLEAITRFTLEQLSRAAQPEWQPLEYVDYINCVLPQAFNRLKPELSKMVTLSEVETLCGFILGGYYQREPFIGRILYQGERLIANEIQITPGYGIVVGGYSCDGDQLLMNHITQNPDLKASLLNGLESSIRTITAIKNSMADTIREIGTHESSVGGKLYFSIIRRGQTSKVGEIY